MKQRSKRRSSSEWFEWVERWEASAQPAAVFAAEHGLHPKTLVWWRSESRKRGRRRPGSIRREVPERGAKARRPATSGFTEVRLVPTARPASSSEIEISLPNGAVIHLRGSGGDASVLAGIVQAVSRC